jgi:hypothetical protein
LEFGIRTLTRPAVFAVALFTATAATAAPCVTATASCTEWVSYAGQSRSLIYRSYPLDARNDRLTRAFIMVHGAGRDADHYFSTAMAAAFLAGALDDAIVISPRFASNDTRGCRDTLAANEVNWPCSGDSWRSGGVATNVHGRSGAGADLSDTVNPKNSSIGKLRRRQRTKIIV